MKQFFKMFFASLLAMIVAAVIVVGLTVGLVINGVRKATSHEAPAVSKKSLLVIDLDEKLHEQSEKNSIAAISKDAAYNAGLYDALEAIKAAKKDDNIPAILLELKGTPNGWATCQQMREALLDFKSIGKPIYAYAEGITQKDYFVASTANTIYLNPVGGMELRGLASQIPFFKGTLDMLGLQPEIFYAGKFKSATEPFRADKMSEPNRQQVSELLNGVWSQFLLAAAQKSGADTAAIQQWTNTGAIRFAADAAQHKLVDGAGYVDELEAIVRKKMDLDSDDRIPTISLDDYADHVADARDLSSNRIALLFAEGEIVDGEGSDYQIASENIVKTIRTIARNDKIKAVVLRINSPGGSALASEVILRELQLLRAKKPIIVSMGDVAASGGYYISCAADSVFAMPNTITGSIGVFAMMFNIAPLLKDKLGVTFDGVKTNPYADFPTGSRELTEDEKARLQESVDTIYATFKRRVSVARRLSVEQVDSIAQGRVWTGTAALRIGLVDAIGGMDRAIASAAAKAKLKDYTIVTYPDPVDRFQSTIRRFKSSPLGAMAIDAAIKSETGFGFEPMKRLQELQKTQGKALMALPCVPEIQ